MRKVRSRKLAILLVLAFMATMFAGIGTASAASTYSVLAAPTVLNNGSAQALGTIQIDFPQLEAKKQTLLITLPSSFEVDFAAPGTNSPAVTFTKSGNNAVAALQASLAAGTVNPGVIKNSDREFKVEFTPGSADYDVRLLLTLPSVVVPDSADGDVKAVFTCLAGNFSGGDVVVAKAGTQQVSVYVNDTITFSSAGTTGNAVEINFKENVSGAIKSGNSTIKIKLPKGMSWAGNGAIDSVNAGAASGDLTPVKDPADTSGRVLLVNRTATKEGKIFRVKNDINVDDSEAVLGDVEVAISGLTKCDPSSLKIGEYVDYGIKAVVVGDVPNIKPGRLEQEVADFNIEENAKASIINNRSITLELPAGAKWQAVNAPTCTGGLGMTAAGITTVGTDGRKVKFTATNSGSSKGKFKFENVEVILAVDFTGDLTVAVEGAGLDKTELVLAKAPAALTGVADSPDIKIGVQNQDGGTIKLTEGFKEALINGEDLYVTLPFGIEWASIPTVKVIEGDLDIDENSVNKARGWAALGNRGGVLTIPIKSQSTKASTIEISDVKLTVDRTVPEGPIEIEVTGPAIDQVNYLSPATAYGLSTTNANGEFFPRNTVACEVVGAKCVTPAPGETKVVSVFTVGEAKYTVSGVEVAMNVAPYIDANTNSTLMPVRAAANAVGVDNDNIFWDDATKTVTILKGDRVVTMTIGKTAMTVNGASIAMPQAPVIKAGSTMLPIRALSTALNADITWDQATQTITVTPK